MEEPSALPGLARLNNLVRSVKTPEFAGITFHEVLAKSALNKVPGGSAMPFGWTINPYRGCSHACVYCFARPTHTYLDLDSGKDFDNEIIVKINVAEVLAQRTRETELGPPPGRARHQHRPVPACGRPLRPDARHHRSADGLRNPVQHPDQGHPAEARSRPDRRRGRARSRRPGDVDRRLRRRTAAVGRTRDADDEGATRDGDGSPRARSRLRRLPHADPAVPHRYASAPRRSAEAGEGSRGDLGSLLRPAPEAGREGVVLSLARARASRAPAQLPQALLRRNLRAQRLPSVARCEDQAA